MRPAPRQPPSLIMFLTVGIALSACSGDGDHTNRPDDGSDGGAQAATRLDEALGRLSASTLDGAATTKAKSFDAILFGDNKRIAELAADDEEQWTGMLSWGGPGPEALPTDISGLGLDLEAASYSINVGFGMPDAVILVSGGQSEDAVRDGAAELGYEGDPILDGAEATDPVSWATQVQPLGEDVLIGGEDADLDALDPDGDTLNDEQKIAGVASCLDDPLAALIAPQGEDGEAIGVGLTVDGDEKQAIYCLPGDEARADALVKALSNPSGPTSPKGPSLQDIRSEVSDGMIRATATIDDKWNPNAAFSPYLQMWLIDV